MTARADLATLAASRPTVKFRDTVLQLRPVAEWGAPLFEEIQVALASGRAIAACQLLLGDDELARFHTYRPKLREIRDVLDAGVRQLGAHLGVTLPPAR